MKIFLLSLSFLVWSQSFCSQPYHQTAFIAEEGATDLLFSYSTYSADHFRNKKGKKLPTYNDFFAENYKIYAEYAWSDCNSFTLNGGYTFGRTKLDGNKFGFDDLEVGWKHLINGTENTALTFQLMGIVPCMKYKPLITYGKWGAQGGLIYSKFFTFWDHLGWYDLGAAYRFYEGFPSDQIRSNATLGLNFGPEFAFLWTFIGSLFLEYGIYNGKDGFCKNHIFLNPNYRLVKAQLECRFSPLIFPNLTVTLGGFVHVWERQISLGKGFIGGTWFDF